MERPIIFSAAMVRAILEGRKTQHTKGKAFPANCGFTRDVSEHSPYGMQGIVAVLLLIMMLMAFYVFRA